MFRKLICFVVAFYTTTTFGKTLVQYIGIEGHNRVDSAFVLKHAGIKQGQFVNDTVLNEALKNLYATEQFKDVALRLKEGHLTYLLEESPTINRIVFEGYEEVKLKSLKEQMKIGARDLYAPYKMRYEIERLLAIYRSKGLFSAKVDPKLIKRDHNRVDVVFEINEGKVAEIGSINFIGNKDITAWDLRSIIMTRESAWWRFLSTADVFDPDRLKMDEEKLKKFYLNRGYVDFKLHSVTAELSHSKDAFVISFNLEEGERYRFGKIAVENEVDGLSDAVANKGVEVKEGAWYALQLIEVNINNMQNVISKAGYSFVDIVPDVKVNEESKTVDVTFRVQPSERFFVNNIDIEGNVRTIDKVVRRELTFAEGDALNYSKLRNSEYKVKALGFFKDVEFEKKDVEDKHALKDILIKVKEQHTGDINFTGGYGVQDGFLANIRFNERNLFGRGYDGSVGLEWASRRQYVSADFVNPNLFGRELMFGVGTSYSKLNRLEQSSFTEKSYGGRFFLRYFLSTHLIQGWSYAPAYEDLGLPGANTFPILKKDRGKAFSSVFGHDLTLDYRDNRLYPRNGFMVSFSTQHAGLGSKKIKYLKNTLNTAYYKELYEDVILEFHGRFSIMHPLANRNIRINDKMMLGGTSLRGFDYNGVGPHGLAGAGNKKKYAESSLGGDRSIILSAQLNFPLGLPEDIGVTGHVFCDAGSLWDSKLSGYVKDYNKQHPNEKLKLLNYKKLRVTVGVGLMWMSPLGLLTVDYAKILRKAKGDEEKAIIINVGSMRF